MSDVSQGRCHKLDTKESRFAADALDPAEHFNRIPGTQLIFWPGRGGDTNNSSTFKIAVMGAVKAITDLDQA